MSYSINLEVKGLDKFLKMLDDTQKNLADELDSAVESGAELIYDTAITLVPVKTGNLKHSGTIVREKPLERIVRFGGPSAPYALYVEMGHMTKSGKRIGPFPFLRPSVDARRNEVVELIRLGIARVFGNK